MSYKKNLLKDLSFLFSEKLLGILLGLATTFMAYRMLAAQGFGVIGILESTFACATSLVAFRTTESLTRSLIDFKQKGVAVTSLVRISLTIDLATRIIAMVLVAMAFYLFSGYFGNHQVSIDLLLLMFAGQLLIFPQDTFFSLIREQREFKYLTMASISSKIALLVGVGLLFFFNQTSVYLYLLALIASNALQLCFYIVYIRGYCDRDRQGVSPLADGLKAFTNPFRFYRDDSYSDYWYFLKMGFWTSTLSGLIKNGTDMIIMGLVGTTVDIGHYKLAKSLAGRIQLVPQILSPYFFQDFSEWVTARKFDRLRHFLKRVAILWTPLVIVISLVAYLVSQPVITQLFGESSAPAVTHFRILLTGIFVQLSLFWIQPLILSMKLLKAQLIGVAFVTFGFFSIILFATPMLGVYSVSTALAFAWGGGYLYLAFILLRKKHLLRENHVENAEGG